MPWHGVSPVDLRMRFVTEYLTEQFSMTELAASYGISRKTAYYWVKHYERDGPGRLMVLDRTSAADGGGDDQHLAGSLERVRQ